MQRHSFKKAFKQIKKAFWLPLVIPLTDSFHDVISDGIRSLQGRALGEVYLEVSIGTCTWENGACDSPAGHLCLYHEIVQYGLLVQGVVPSPQHYTTYGSRWHLEEEHKGHECSTTWSADRSAVLVMDWEGATDFLTAQNHSEHLSRVSCANPQLRGMVLALSGACHSFFNSASVDNWSDIQRTPTSKSSPSASGTLPHLQAVHMDTAFKCLLEQHGLYRCTWEMGKRHISHHLLRAWPYREWWMPAVSTGTSALPGFVCCW